MILSGNWTGKTTAIRPVRDTGVSRHNGDQIEGPIQSLEHHSSNVPRGWKRLPNHVPRGLRRVLNHAKRRSALEKFQSGTEFVSPTV